MKKLAVITESFRDWGRDCWCPSEIGIPVIKDLNGNLDFCQGYDHKYTYSHLGFNLKPLDIQAAIGRIQLSRLNNFIDKRRRIEKILRENLIKLKNILNLRSLLMLLISTQYLYLGQDWMSFLLFMVWIHDHCKRKFTIY